MSLAQSKSIIDKAILTATGNSLVVCGSSSALRVNTSDMIKTDGTTTKDYLQSGSTAYLNIKSGSTILYAELVWYSTVKSNVSGSTDLRSVQDNPITFNTPKGEYEITPQYTESYTGSSGSIDRFRAADVTSYVTQSGNYTVSKVPTSIPSSGLSNTRAGWTLVVIYRNDAFKPQKIIYNSGIFVATAETPLQYTVTGFTTSSEESKLGGCVFLACANGEPLNGSEVLSAGPSFANLFNLGNIINRPHENPGTAPNNPGNGFFSGVINVADPLDSNDGLLNVNGTNGSNNNDGFIPTQNIGARNKWDITNVNLAKALVPNQTLLAGQITETETVDGVQLVAFGTQVNVNAPNITAKLDAYDIDGDSEYNIRVGEQIVFTVQVKNDGDMAANNVTLSSVLDSTTSFVANSVTVNGVTQPGASIVNGVNVGTIAAKGVANVTYTVRVNSLPSSHFLHPVVNYNYQFVSGIDTITNYASTNALEIIVQQGLLEVVKSADITEAVVNDVITYTVKITNIGTEKASNMFLQDKINPYCSFVAGSVIIGSTTYAEYNPNNGINLPDLPVSSSVTIKFKAKINSIPPSAIITNKAYISFSYIFNQDPFNIEKTLYSNETSVQVNYIDIVGKRTNDNQYPKVGDRVTYTLSLTNIGNVSASNVQVLEPSIYGATFVPGSVKINGQIQQSDLNPFEGFILPSPIGSNQTTTVEYKVDINEINPADTVKNIANVPFKYTIVEGGNETDGEKDSNQVQTVANYVCMNISESVDKSYALVEDKLYYKVNITNDGNIDAINTVFSSNIQSDTTFIPGTVTINGAPYTSYNPQTGFSVGDIYPGNIVEVGFQVTVNQVPNPNIVYNQSSLVYSYKPDPTGNTLTNSIISNTVQTIINKAQYTVTKTVDKAYAQIGDALVYKTTIKNTGTVVISDVMFFDPMGYYLSFYPETVYVNGISYPDYDPNIAFPVGDIHPGDTASVVFGATIINPPPIGYIQNVSDMTLNYKENPDTPIITKTVYSNPATTFVANGKLEIIKNVDKSYATLDDILNYSFTVTNIGNVPVINTKFVDTIQVNGEFISESVVVNDISKPSFDPNTGFTLNTINVGQVVTISFKVKVKTLPNPNVIKNTGTVSYSYYSDPDAAIITKNTTSNTVNTIINTYSATLTKSVDKDYATIGEELNYTVIASNTGTVVLNNVNFKDILPNGATFNIGSVILDGVSLPDANPSTGFIINNVLPGGNVVVMFKATVTSLPTPPQIDNKATVDFKYRLNPNTSYTDGSLTSNTATTYIKKMTVTNTKSVDKQYATVSSPKDVLTYTSVIANNGNIDITDTFFVDIVPTHTTFVPGSVKIDGVDTQDNPNTGFTIGTITPGKSKTIVFKVTVDSLPENGYVQNTSNLNYKYQINPSGEPIIANATSNTVTTYINLGTLTATKTPDRTIAKTGNIVTYNFVVTNTGNTTLKELVFKDNINTGSAFNANSVYIDGVNYPSLNPEGNGFSLNDIEVGHQRTVSFSVTIVKPLPEDNKLLNTADITFSYYVKPNDPTTKITQTTNSNTSTVYVYDTIISATKTVNKSKAKLNEVLDFTITLNNDSNTDATNVKLTDNLDTNILLVPNSVKIDGNTQTGFDFKSGPLDIGTIPAEGESVITFSATIKTRPLDNIIKNFGIVDYKYNNGTEIVDATINTNTTQTYVAVGELTLTKLVDKLIATVGDNLSYSVKVQNTGSVNATSLIFKDLMPSNTSFNTGSVVVDGVNQPDFNPASTFELSDLTPLQYHTVTFSIRVDSLPITEKVENTADTTFTYKLTDTDTPVTTTTTSNKVTTLIKKGELYATKSVDKLYATIGDTINYTIDIKNKGNANCFDVFFKDIVQSNAEFTAGSVKINGETKPDYNPNTGFYLDDISAYKSTTVTFAVTVKSVPPVDYTIYNYATGSYKYYIDPANPPVVVEGITNTVSTLINKGSLSATKSVSKAFATLGDTISYTVSVLNDGNVTAKNINFRDVVPTGLTFVPGSVKIDNISYPTYDPYASFTLGNIISGDSLVVAFDTTVTSLPNPSLIYNKADLTFAYKIDPGGSDIIKSIESNTVDTKINVGSLNLTKSVDKAYASRGYVLNYAVVVANNGNVDATNVFFEDALQSDIIFDTQSVTIDNVPYTEYDPNIGFNLGTITPGNSITVKFSATVIQSPTHSSVINFAVGTFSYKIDTRPSGATYSKSVQSNSVLTILSLPSYTLTTTVDKAYATLQDTLNYSVLATNTGNTTIYKIFFTDILSNGAIFKSGTIVIDGVPYANLDPIEGFLLPNNALVAGNTSLIQFQATITSRPTPPQVNDYAETAGKYKVDPQGEEYDIPATSNTVTTYINVGSLSNVKVVSKEYAKVGDTITYTSTITNTGNVNATNIKFIDQLDSALSFVSGTVRINNVLYPSLDPTVVGGFSLSDLAPGQIVTVAFDAKINVLPVLSYVLNTSNAVFSYKIDPNGTSLTKTQTSNSVRTDVVLGKINATKIVDKSIATVGDVLTYTVTLTNVGNVIDYDVYFKDIPSEGVTFKTGSVKINGTAHTELSPINGFTLIPKDIGIGEVVTIEFKVDVTSVPSTNKVTNQATITFKYYVDPKQPLYSDTTYSDTVTTNIAYGNLSVTKVVNKQYATIGEELTYTVTIVNIGNINATNVTFLDPTPRNSVFVTGSVTVNGISHLDYNPSAGFDLGTLTPGQIKTVIYKVKVIDLC